MTRPPRGKWIWRISAPQRSLETRRKISASLRGWFDLRPGLRGLSVGPIFYLGWGHPETHGRMLAWIRNDGFASEIWVMSLAVPAVLAFVFCGLAGAICAIGGTITGSLNAMGAIPLAIASLAFSGGVLLLFNCQDFTVHPVRLALGVLSDAEMAERPRLSTAIRIASPVVAQISGGAPVELDEASLRQTLNAIACGEEEFVILERSEFDFLQVRYDGIGFVVERRLSQSEWLQSARHAGAPGSVLDDQDVFAIMSCYLGGKDEMPGVEWVD